MALGTTKLDEYLRIDDIKKQPSIIKIPEQTKEHYAQI